MFGLSLLDDAKSTIHELNHTQSLRAWDFRSFQFVGSSASGSYNGLKVLLGVVGFWGCGILGRGPLNPTPQTPTSPSPNQGPPQPPKPTLNPKARFKLLKTLNPKP